MVAEVERNDLSRLDERQRAALVLADCFVTDPARLGGDVQRRVLEQLSEREIVEAFTRSSRPDFVNVSRDQSDRVSRSSAFAWTVSAGPSATSARLPSVTRVAISMIRHLLRTDSYGSTWR